MSLVRPSTMVIFLAAALLGVALFKVKYAVQSDEQQLAAIQTQIVHDRDAIHVLHAEWASETQPERLGELATRLGNLAPIAGVQMGSYDALPMRAAPAPAVAVAQNAAAPAVAATATATPAAAAPVIAAAAAPVPVIRTTNIIRVAETMRAPRTEVAASDPAVDAVLQAMQGDVGRGDVGGKSRTVP